MYLARSEQIPEIDRYAADRLGIPTVTLMGRAGHAVAKAIAARLARGSSVVVLAGPGNNGGDGYAAAAELFRQYSVLVLDVLSLGQSTEEGRHYLRLYRDGGGRAENLTLSDEQKRSILTADCIVDAIFGSGARGDYPRIVEELCEVVAASEGALRVAVDIPIGIDADSGSLRLSRPPKADLTVALSFLKPGLVSYPARDLVGELLLDGLGLDAQAVAEHIRFTRFYTDSGLAATLMPKREQNSSKGSFGRLLLLCGSHKYRGAAHLSLEAALRGGVGLVTYAGEGELCRELLCRLPEAIYEETKPYSELDGDEIERLTALSERHSATLVGCGAGCSEGLYSLLSSLLSSRGGPLLLDADAINALAEHRPQGLRLLDSAMRPVILTPHPLELARLMGVDTSEVQLHRIELATSFAAEHGVILVLKGAATVTTDGVSVYINSSGSSALAKAGSGDVLAGLVGALAAQGMPPLSASALAVYLHGAASDTLSSLLSELGVTPSDLPRAIAMEMARLSQKGVKHP